MTLPEVVVSFTAGAAYGFTSVCVGQPLDTIKTRMQSAQGSSSLQVGIEVFRKEGIPGLYRGGIPLVLGGAIIRSAQFGFYENTLSLLRTTWPNVERVGPFDMQVVVSGFVGGFGRGLAEGPFEFVKVRRQCSELGVRGRTWSIKEIYRGSGITMLRNAFLFGVFAINMDFYDNSTKALDIAPPFFVKGAICANLAWLSIWPLDVVKTQVQSGQFKDQSILAMLKSARTSGLLYRGLVPGLMRSTIANGCALTVYSHIKEALST
eukprot:GEMP01075885.1.p1 GENE.GEMP01075885.1~~GEMP01075885.1.p1  ORF type:complete len:264 (+),score=37.82 GEMP01075885.1:20-811(+)